MFAALIVNGQVLFQHNFENGMAPMTVKDLSGRTVDPSVAGLAGGWVAISGANFGMSSNIGASTSWFSPPGQANAWMITPPIVIENEGVVLKWLAKAQDPSYRDGYQVLISTTGTEVEDFTDVLFQVANESATLVERSEVLSAYVGETIHIAFRNNSVDQYVLVIDDIVVESLLDYNIKMDEMAIKRYHLIGSSVSIEGNLTNQGNVTINSFDLNWTHDGETRTQSVTGLDLDYGQSYAFNHNDQFDVTLPTNEEIVVNISNINGIDSLDFSSENKSAFIQGISQVPVRNVVYEEGTGTWCGWCPRGFVAMEIMEEEPNFIGIAVHNGDPMVISSYDSNMNLSGYPGANVNRSLNNIGVSPDIFLSVHSTLLNEVTPVSANVKAEYDETTRNTTIDVDATFYSQFDGDDFRFSVIIIEDSIRGTSSGYSQVNFYNLGTNPTAPALIGYGFNWNQEPDPVPASKMFYNHVPVSILGGYFGEQGSIPSSISLDQKVTKSYTYNVAASRNPNNMKAVVLVLDANTGEILNAAQTKFDIKLNSNNIVSPEKFELQLYPNPASVELNVEMTLPSAAKLNYNITNINGQVVISKELGMTSGDIKFTEKVSHLAPGVYSLVINAGNEVTTKNFIVE